jgi:hypothetical protein
MGCAKPQVLLAVLVVLFSLGLKAETRTWVGSWPEQGLLSVPQGQLLLIEGNFAPSASSSSERFSCQLRLVHAGVTLGQTAIQRPAPAAFVGPVELQILSPSLMPYRLGAAGQAQTLVFKPGSSHQLSLPASASLTILSTSQAPALDGSLRSMRLQAGLSESQLQDMDSLLLQPGTDLYGPLVLKFIMPDHSLGFSDEACLVLTFSATALNSTAAMRSVPEPILATEPEATATLELQRSSDMKSWVTVESYSVQTSRAKTYFRLKQSTP